ncbi:hypothetical protein A2U01_0102661, partial [Trifolium medium]|nr:hypothetical protein [Trifolium medium]
TYWQSEILSAIRLQRIAAKLAVGDQCLVTKMKAPAWREALSALCLQTEVAVFCDVSVLKKKTGGAG